jgi:tetratricopeptide (TPR) repeat protein
MSQNFKQGAKVRIVGLKSEREYNGLGGIIKKKLPNGRLCVQVTGSMVDKELSVTVENVKALEKTDSQAPHSLSTEFSALMANFRQRTEEGDYEKVVLLEGESLPAANTMMRFNPGAALQIFKWLGFAYFKLGTIRKALDLFYQALEAANLYDSDLALCDSYSNLGIALLEDGNPMKALELHKISLQIAEKLGLLPQKASAHGNIGNSHYSLGNFPSALYAHREHLCAAQQLGDRFAEGRALAGVAAALLATGDPAASLDTYRERLALAQEVGDEAAECNAYVGMGEAYHRLARFADALRMSGLALELARRRGYAAAAEKARSIVSNFHRQVHHTGM